MNDDVEALEEVEAVLGEEEVDLVEDEEEVVVSVAEVDMVGEVLLLQDSTVNQDNMDRDRDEVPVFDIVLTCVTEGC